MDVTYATVNKPRRGPAPPGPAPPPGSPGRRPLPHPGAPPHPLSPPPPPGFNFRIGKPKGPREPPAEWSRV
ncbi:unnamed protein product [Bubo scandiacus]